MFLYEIFLVNYVIYSLPAHASYFKFEDASSGYLYYMILPIYLVIGLVADICIGRYRIIVMSFYCAFVGWLIVAVSFYMPTESLAGFVLLGIGFLGGTVGAAGVQSISVPFNIDQLVGATADELSAVIYWHVFGYPLGYSVCALLCCTIAVPLYVKTVDLCVSGTAIAIALATYYLLRHHLDTTPLLTNPIKLIVKVLNYARKNKYFSRHRSALTYWEDSSPSQLDLGKDKYGGPFTEEEVEDVKTFLRFLPLLVCMYGVGSFILDMPFFATSDSVSRGMVILDCLLDVSAIPYIAMVIALLAHKALFNKLFSKCTMLTRIGMGLCILLLCNISFLILDLKDYHTTSNNCTIERYIPVYYDETTINYVLLIVSEVIGGSGVIFILLVSLELTVAQSPGHMRGLMVGVWYGAISLFCLLSYGVSMSLTRTGSHCGFYYHLTLCVLVSITILLYRVVAKHYKLRARNQVINIHHVVTTVYERYLEQAEQNKQQDSIDFS